MKRSPLAALCVVAASVFASGCNTETWFYQVDVKASVLAKDGKSPVVDLNVDSLDMAFTMNDGFTIPRPIDQTYANILGVKLNTSLLPDPELDIAGVIAFETARMDLSRPGTKNVCDEVCVSWGTDD